MPSQTDSQIHVVHASGVIKFRDGQTVPVAEALSRINDEIMRRDAVELRLAQALRLIRDTSSGSTATIASRALAEAGIPDPEDDGVF